ncbi:Gldg family protein [Luteolibacter sp. LG18]|uniref:Gldg family protein n=1 Tax=Luteolibacter sp. LG18 TaxID=2819286 RepID=UPI002B2E8B90|nr:hypothetical protein llg_02990 [Luteolibacter sp. LG18]
MSAKTTHPVLRTVLGIIPLILIVVLGNVLVSSLGIGHRGADFTENKIHTLSDGTKAILKELDAPVVIRYYASRKTGYLPEDLKLHMRHVDDLLKEYSTLAGGKLRVENLDPQPDTDAEDSANLDGMSGQRINDENLFFGMAISCLEKTTTIPFLDPNDETMLEYQLSRAISEVSTAKKPVVGVISALELDGAPAMMPGQQPTQGWVIYQQLKQSYDVKNLGMTPGVIDPKEIKVLLLFHPANITPEAEFAVDQYVLQGGTVVACLDAFSVAAQMTGGGNPMMGGGGAPTSSTLPTLLKAWGVNFESSQVVADGTYATQMAQNRKSAAVLTLPQAAMQKDNVVTRNLDSVTLFLPGGFTKTGGSGVSINSLIRTTDKAGLVDAMRAAQLDPKLDTTMERKGVAYDIALTLDGKFKTAFPNGNPADAAKPADGEKKDEPKKPDSLKEATAEGHVFLIGDVDAFYDRFAYSVQNFGGMQMVSPINGNSSLLMNIIDQAGGSSHLIGARSRSATRRPFDVIQKMEDDFNKTIGTEISKFEKQKEEAQQKLSALQSQKSRGSDLYLSPEQEAEIKKLREQQVTASGEVRKLEKDLKRQKDSLFGNIFRLNVLAMPALVALFTIGLFITHRSRTRAR